LDFIADDFFVGPRAFLNGESKNGSHHGRFGENRKGRFAKLKQVADRILSLRGVKHGKFVVTTTGKDLK
jgi:hypothetical protein